jgi:hypothetical protein
MLDVAKRAWRAVDRQGVARFTALGDGKRQPYLAEAISESLARQSAAPSLDEMSHGGAATAMASGAAPGAIPPGANPDGKGGPALGGKPRQPYLADAITESLARQWGEPLVAASGAPSLDEIACGRGATGVASGDSPAAISPSANSDGKGGPAIGGGPRIPCLADAMTESLARQWGEPVFAASAAPSLDEIACGRGATAMASGDSPAEISPSANSDGTGDAATASTMPSLHGGRGAPPTAARVVSWEQLHRWACGAPPTDLSPASAAALAESQRGPDGQRGRFEGPVSRFVGPAAVDTGSFGVATPAAGKASPRDAAEAAGFQAAAPRNVDRCAGSRQAAGGPGAGGSTVGGSAVAGGAAGERAALSRLAGFVLNDRRLAAGGDDSESGDDLGELADKIKRILNEEARRHGIDV